MLTSLTKNYSVNSDYSNAIYYYKQVINNTLMVSNLIEFAIISRLIRKKNNNRL